MSCDTPPSSETRALLPQQDFTCERVDAVSGDHQIGARMSFVGELQCSSISILDQTDKLLAEMKDRTGDKRSERRVKIGPMQQEEGRDIAPVRPLRGGARGGARSRVSVE